MGNLLIEIIKYAGTAGLLSAVLKIFADRLLTTEVEKSLETNFKRIMRMIFDYVLTLLYILVLIFGVYLISESKPLINSTQSTSNNLTWQVIFYLLVILAIVLIPLFYLVNEINKKYFCRTIYYNDPENGDKYIVLKTLSNSLVLLEKEQHHLNNYRTITKSYKFLDVMKLKELHLESYEDRKNRRQIQLEELSDSLHNRKLWSFLIMSLLILNYLIVKFGNTPLWYTSLITIIFISIPAIIMIKNKKKDKVDFTQSINETYTITFNKTIKKDQDDK